MKTINRFDDYFIYIFNDKLKSKTLDKFMYNITDVGGAIGTSIVAIIIFFIGLKLKNGYEFIGLEVLLSLAITQLVVQILKRTVKRTRPYDARDRINTFDIKLPDYSFPSGHTTASFTLATVLSLNNSLWIIPSYIYASIIGISRVYLGVHYPSDVLFGMVFGITSSIIIHYYIFGKVLFFIKSFILI